MKKIEDLTRELLNEIGEDPNRGFDKNASKGFKSLGILLKRLQRRST